MKQTKLKEKVFSGVFWRFGEQISSQLVSFLVSIVLARLLEPKQYGVIAIVSVFISLANVFINDSFSKALIQKKEISTVAFSSVFYFNIIFSWIIYLVIYIMAPFIANFYHEPILIPVTRGLALLIPIAGINSIQQAYVSRKMQFQRFFWSTLIGTIGSGIIGILMAYNGYGIWALVGQQISNNLINTLVLWFTVKWRPTLEFSRSSLLSLISFGWKVLVTNLINTVYDNLKSLIMGKIYTSSILAFYNRGYNYPSLLISNITISLDSVLFPAMSKIQDDKLRLKKALRKSISLSTYIVFPLMAGLAGISHNLIIWMLTKKWESTVPYMQICCIVFALYPINIVNLQAILAVGKSGTYLTLNIIKKGIGIAAVLISIPFGPYVMVSSDIIVGILAIITNVSANKRFFNYTFVELAQDCFLNGCISLFMYFCVVSTGKIGGLIFSGNFLPMCIQILIGILVYIMLSLITHSKDFKYLLSLVRK